MPDFVAMSEQLPPFLTLHAVVPDRPFAVDEGHLGVLGSGSRVTEFHPQGRADAVYQGVRVTRKRDLRIANDLLVEDCP